MSAPVDVLAVIDKEIARAGGVYFEDGRNLIDARAAVAELIERERKASEMLAIALEAVEIADGVMAYCQGDAWEREATADSRDEFQRKYEILFPPPPTAAVPKRARPDWRTCDQCGGRYRGEQGLRDHTRDRHGPARVQGGAA